MTSYEALLQTKDNHKLMERQRRQDMKRLCLLLKSLLPPENLKGKRSLPDQLLASACYISDLEVRVAQLKKKRDELRILSDAERISQEKVCEIIVPCDVSGMFPSVRISNVGLGVEVSVNAFKQQVELSNLVEVLEGGGIEVVSALVSAAKDKVFYTLQCQVSDAGSFDCSMVYGRIWDLLNRKSSCGQ